MKKKNNDHLIEKFIHDSHYMVTEDGKILTKHPPNGRLKIDIDINTIPWRERYQDVKPDGYCSIAYKKQNILVHRIVYRVFYGPLQGKEVSHIDGNYRNNHYTNLKLTTMSQLQVKRYLEKPEYHPSSAKIDESDLKLIWSMRLAGKSLIQIAKAVNLSKTNISYIVGKRIWIDESNAILEKMNKRMNREAEQKPLRRPDGAHVYEPRPAKA